MFVFIFAMLPIPHGINLGSPTTNTVPLNLNDEQAEYWGHVPQCRTLVVNWKPIWMSYGQNLLKTAPLIQEYHTKESNLEHWQNLKQRAKNEDITPRKAMPITAKSHDYYYWGSFNDQAMCTHAPWYLTVQEHWPDYFGSEPVLFYEVIRTPTMQKPYYEAFVCSMPNVRCKAKTLEALQEQLLQQYSQYLATMLQDEEDFPTRQPSMRPNHEWLNGSFIAWLIGAAYEEQKPEMKSHSNKSGWDKPPDGFVMWFFDFLNRLL